jgi:hypothetical protein
MYYLTYNNEDRAGAGAQVQRILSLFLLAKHYNIGYVHTGFITQEHEFTEDVLAQFNNLFELSGYNKQDFDETIHAQHFTEGIVSFIRDNPQPNKDILIVIPGAHLFIDSNPWLLNDVYPIRFSWIQETLDPETQVAFHIRRGYDVSQTVNADRFVEVSVYFDYIKELRNIIAKPHKFHIFSKKEILPELDAIHIDEDVVLHIEEDVMETFKFLVNCDVLFAGPSSFSYSAAMLRRKGVVLYNPFWHSYPEKCVCLSHPEDVHRYKERILQNL